MATVVETFKSSVFRVKNNEEFFAWCVDLGFVYADHTSGHAVSFQSHGDEISWGGDPDRDMVGELQEMLQDDEYVFVSGSGYAITAGGYLTEVFGWAQFITKTHTDFIETDEILQRAEAHLGRKIYTML